MVFIVVKGIETLFRSNCYYEAKHFFFERARYQRNQDNKYIRLLVKFQTAKYAKQLKIAL